MMSFKLVFENKQNSLFCVQMFMENVTPNILRLFYARYALFSKYSPWQLLKDIKRPNTKKGILTIASLDMWSTKEWGFNPSTMLKKKRMIRRKRYRYFEC